VSGKALRFKLLINIPTLHAFFGLYAGYRQYKTMTIICLSYTAAKSNKT
jgi:hypothetical protein